MSFKNKRLEENIKRQVSYLIKNSLKNSSLASKEINIVRVDMSGFSLAKVYVGSIKGRIYARQALKHLNSALGFIRHEISKNLRLKKVPQIKFIADDSVEYEEHLNELFSKIKKNVCCEKKENYNFI